MTQKLAIKLNQKFLRRLKKYFANLERLKMLIDKIEHLEEGKWTAHIICGIVFVLLLVNIILQIK